MTKMIFINLPVTDVSRATRFYEALGFTRNPAFSNEQASAMGWSDAIHVMLLDHAFYATFTGKPIADAHAASAALYCLSFDSRDAVDAITEAARTAGRMASIGSTAGFGKMRMAGRRSMPSGPVASSTNPGKASSATSRTFPNCGPQAKLQMDRPCAPFASPHAQPENVR